MPARESWRLFMNIFLEVFVDTNFGDDLFIHTVVARYPEHTFYMLEKAGFEESYRLLSVREQNIRLVKTDELQQALRKMQGMLIVGGDMLFNGSVYLKLIRNIRTIKKQGGFVAFLGLSLFPEYCLRSRIALRWMFSKADYMVVREQSTLTQIKALAPNANVRSAADMAFATDVSEVKKKPCEKGLLGISVRKKIQRGCDTYESYCKRIAETAMVYLDKSDEHKVAFLALSRGVFDDSRVAEDIMALCPEAYRNRMNIISFEGDVDGYICQMQACEKLICTRFHALVFAILLGKPFVPVVYEEKMERLLNEIGYQGPRPKYEDMPEAGVMLTALDADMDESETKLSYLAKVKTFFDETDCFCTLNSLATMNKM